MPKHAPNVPKGTPSDRSDERIGLTEAFSPVGDAQAPVDGSDERIGLTEAFSPVGDGAHAGGFSYRGDNDDEYPDAIEALEPVDAPPLLFGDDTVAAEPEEPQGRHGKQKKEKKQKQQIPAYQRKSRRMRRVLIAIVVLLILLIGALGYFAWQWFEESQLIATQQTQEQQSSQEVGSMQTDETKDATTATAKKTNVPNLAAVLGMTKDEAIEKTLQEAGVNVPAGSAQLPADKTEYSEYASDGTTLVKESYSFSGTVDLNGAAHEWSALLLYNYSTANTSGNLADTIRIVYVYVNA